MFENKLYAFGLFIAVILLIISILSLSDVLTDKDAKNYALAYVIIFGVLTLFFVVKKYFFEIDYNEFAGIE